MAKQRTVCVRNAMLPTDCLHLSNYMGAPSNWGQLQDQYDCFSFITFITDLHAHTTNHANPAMLRQNIRDVTLSAGLDPERDLA